ncbi:MAG: beta-lactamase family protein [Christensenellaceae bacterium]|jgi:CubicO group peptidase (beta-lactamase class C family)|nr:beta-lactamase family protein [Christensenellaceae bacterium]
MFSLEGLREDAKRKNLTLYGVLVTQDGHEKGKALWRSSQRINIHSLSKSFASCAVGLAMEEGLFGIDDRVLSFFPEKIDGSPSKNLEELRIRQLLTMSSGHEAPLLMGNQRDDLEDEDWVHYFLNQPFVRAPGSAYLYDTGNTYLLSAILQKRSGQTLLEYLKPRLFDPLGYRNPQWFTCPRGITLGGGGLHLSLEEIARFGQLLLDGGSFEGKRLVPEVYLRQATAKQIKTEAAYPKDRPDWLEGYGFQFWRCAREGAYRGDGAYGQFIVVLPRQRAHVAITAHEERDTQGLLTLVWDHVLPQL